MADVANAVIKEAREALLNDPQGAIYTDAKMLPIVKKAYRELQTKIAALGVGTNKEVTSEPIVVEAGTTELGDGSGLPVDFLYPVRIGERAVGSTDVFRTMTEEDWEPDVVLKTMLTFWTWRDEVLKFPGATTDREIQIRYVRNVGTIQTIESPIIVVNSITWLAQRSASIAALTIGANATRSQALMTDLERPGGIWDDFRITLVRRKQGVPVRRRRTRYRPA